MEKLEIGDEVLFNRKLYSSLFPNTRFPTGTHFYDGKSIGIIHKTSGILPDSALVQINVNGIKSIIHVQRDYLLKVGSQKPSNPTNKKLIWKS